VQALGWLSDGVALLKHDGQIAYANEAFEAITRRGDGIRVVRGAIEFTAAPARTRFAAALAAAGGVAKGMPHAPGPVDFFAPRVHDLPAYVVSLRPLVGDRRTTRDARDAMMILFVRDPLNPDSGTPHLLRSVFGLTEAEASLALALQAGMSVGEHARERGITLNTVYTHLRRIKEKTGCARLPQLIQKLNDIRMPARER
jgi:DNA-binding CsgD family transcriptional regulator